MAKDAKGHGSEKRGANQTLMSPPTWDGGTGKPWHDRTAAATLADGNPKAGAVPVHPAQAGMSALVNTVKKAYGSPEAIKDFTNKYGGPRDHAAEQRGFNRGRREINRLKRQGK